MKKLLLGLLLPVMAMANVPDDLILLGKDDDGSEVFVIKSSISYQKPVGLKLKKEIDPILTYDVLENFDNTKQENQSYQSAYYQFFANCPIDVRKPKPPLQGSMGLVFAKKNAQGEYGAIMKNKTYSISNTMAVISLVAVCNHVATHAIPTKEVNFQPNN